MQLKIKASGQQAGNTPEENERASAIVTRGDKKINYYYHVDYYYHK